MAKSVKETEIHRYYVAKKLMQNQKIKNSHFHHTNYAEYLHTKIASPKSRPKHLDLNIQHNPVHQ